MKRTLVERVAEWLFCTAKDGDLWEQHINIIVAWEREARTLIAMVRRHDRKEKGE